MAWTVERVQDEFGEDVLRDVCRDVNDLMCAKAGHGIHANRIGIDESLWRVLLSAGGYTDGGVEKALKGEVLSQGDADQPFTPYTIHTLVNLSSDNGGPLSPVQVDDLITRALKYRQLIS